MLLFLGHQYVVRSAPVLLGSGSEHSPPSARCPEGDQRTLTAALDADNRSVSSRRVRTVLQSPQETGARAARQAAWPPRSRFTVLGTSKEAVLSCAAWSACITYMLTYDIFNL